MLDTTIAYLAAHEPDNTRSLIRAAILFGSLLLGAVLIRWVQTRWAPRTIEAWTGTGVNEDLTLGEAALLIRLEPGAIAAALVAELVLAERMTLEGIRPPRLAWTEHEESSDDVEAALDAAFVTGDGDPDLAQTVLDRLQERVNQKMRPFSGRATAVHYRRRIQRVRHRILAGDPAVGEERRWAMLDEPTRLWNRLDGDHVPADVRDLIRFVGVFRVGFMDRDEISRRANRGGPGFFTYRKELRRHRGPMAANVTVEESSARPTGVFGDTLERLAEALDGAVKMPQPVGLDFTTHDGTTKVEARVLGRHRGRSIAVDFWPAELEVSLVTGSEADHRTRTHRTTTDLEIDDPPLAPYIQLATAARRIVYRAEFDRDRNRADLLMARIEALSDLADFHESAK